MKAKPYRIIGDLQSDKPSLVKVSYEKVYVIVKCKKQSSSLKSIENGLNAFIRGGNNNLQGLYFYLYDHVKRLPGGTFKVKCLMETDNVYELLKAEQEELDKGKLLTNFLNNQTEAYIPEYDFDEKSFGWISQNYVLNFRKWLKNRK
ncbi:MAG: hypothetical protein ABI091_30420 [Ferruginibacter sp.]